MESFRHLHFYFSIAPRLVGLAGIAFRFFAPFGGSFRGLAPDRSNDSARLELTPRGRIVCAAIGETIRLYYLPGRNAYVVFALVLLLT